MKLFTHPKYTNLYYLSYKYTGYEKSGFRISEQGFRFRLGIDSPGVTYL